MCSHSLNPSSANPPLDSSSMRTGVPSFPPMSAANDRARHFGELRANGRRRLWDVPEEYHCPIIGTCLHVDELRSIARKAKSRLDPKSSDYQLHVQFVGSASEKNSLSIPAQKLLEKKHAGAIRIFARAKDEGHLQRLWREGVAAGEVPGAFWALMTHPKVDARLRAQAYQDVHMLSHQVGAGLIGDARSLAETRAELGRVRASSLAQARRWRAVLQQKDEHIVSLEGRLAATQGSERELAQARKTIAELRSNRFLAELHERLACLQGQLDALQQSGQRLTNRAALWRQRCEENQQRLEHTATQLEELRAANRILEQLLEDEPGSARGCECCASDQCSAYPDLAGRRVLCIGGRSSLTCHYRSLVQRCNGELIHHDGGLEESRQRLDSLLIAADIVVCPADCISHDAYLKAKRFCKRAAKPCVFIKSSGVAAFARALGQVAA